MTLYLKYRPQILDELDLESVRDSLRAIIKSGDIPHAFLFSGPKGTGKTSAARILAKIINCENLGKDGEPCNKCESCLSITKGNNIDIIELDAASNRGIDDIRSLKEGVYLTPARAKKKVYIIDEVHMLTIEAANAFLKTLEEPPSHVVFILATTNPEKLPATVISRLTKVNFVRATNKDIARQLTRVAKGEGIKVSEGAIERIAKQADGSFRDAVKILETLSFKTKDIKESDISDLSSGVKEFLRVVENNNVKDALEFIENLVSNGISIKNFTAETLQIIHKSILSKNGLGKDELPNFTEEKLLIFMELVSAFSKDNSLISQLPLEIAVVKFCSLGEEKQVTVTIEEKKEESKKNEIKQEIKEKTSKVIKEKEEPKRAIKVDGTIDEALWQKLLFDTKQKNVSIEALLRSAKPLSFDGKNLSVGVYYQFHKDRLEEGKNSKILEEVCKGVFKIEVIRVSFELIDKPKVVAKPQVESKQELNKRIDKDIIDAAKEIFG